MQIMAKTQLVFDYSERLGHNLRFHNEGDIIQMSKKKQREEFTHFIRSDKSLRRPPVLSPSVCKLCKSFAVLSLPATSMIWNHNTVCVRDTWNHSETFDVPMKKGRVCTMSHVVILYWMCLLPLPLMCQILLFRPWPATSLPCHKSCSEPWVGLKQDLKEVPFLLTQNRFASAVA